MSVDQYNDSPSMERFLLLLRPLEHVCGLFAKEGVKRCRCDNNRQNRALGRNGERVKRARSKAVHRRQKRSSNKRWKEEGLISYPLYLVARYHPLDVTAPPPQRTGPIKTGVLSEKAPLRRASRSLTCG